MPSVSKNVIANFADNIWGRLLSFLLVPVYINYLGIEAYGVIGFLLSFQAILLTLDFGLGATVNREAARCSAQSNSEELCNIIYSLRTIYVIFGIALAILIYISSTEIVENWIHATTLSDDILKLVIIIFGLTVGLRWPVSLYIGVLRGVERQVSASIASSALITIKSLGVLYLLIIVQSNLVNILLWYLFIALVELICYHVLVVNSVKVCNKTTKLFSIKVIEKIWKFSLSVALISIAAIIIKQIDRIFITKLMSVDALGYYFVAVQGAILITLVVGPVQKAVFPRLSSIFFKDKKNEIENMYYKASSIITFISAPFASILIFYSYDFLQLWTQSNEVAQNSYIPLSILALSTLLNIPMHMVYTLQLSTGKQWIPLLNNMIALVIFVPLSYVLIKEYGINGAAVTWLAYNSIYFMVVPHITHKSLGLCSTRKWYFNHTLSYILGSLLIFGAGKYLMLTVGNMTYIAWILFSLIVYLVSVIYFDKIISDLAKKSIAFLTPKHT